MAYCSLRNEMARNETKRNEMERNEMKICSLRNENLRIRQIVSVRVMTLINTNVVESRHIKREEVLLPVAVRRTKTPELKLNSLRGNQNVTHFLGETAFWGEIFCLEYPSRRSEKVNCHFLNYRLSFRKLQILISQTTDFHFANYRFSFRKLRIFISFRFAPFRFANYSKPYSMSHIFLRNSEETLEFSF